MVTMSQKEFQRVKVIENAAGGRLSVREASRLLQLSERQVQRLKRRYRPDSVGWVQHGNRGRPMPWALPVPQKQLILNLARGKYRGFNDSHLAEKLRTEENLAVSRETVRRILRAAKLASPQPRRPRVRLSREHFAARSALAARRICRSPPCSPHLSAEKKKTDASHLQPLRPPCFSGRYLNDMGVTESRCS
jgi:transposase